LQYGECELDHGKGTSVKFDFDTLEKRLIKSLVWKKKNLSTENLDYFLFKGELHLSQNSILTEFSQRLDCVEASTEMLRAIITNTSSDKASLLLSQIEVFFLSSSQNCPKQIEISLALVYNHSPKSN